MRGIHLFLVLTKITKLPAKMRYPTVGGRRIRSCIKMKAFLVVILFVLSLNFFGQTAEEFYKSGIKKGSLNDDKGAIEDYTKAIALNPNFIDAYWNRAVTKHNLNNYKGAIEDYNRIIELNTKDQHAYRYRADCKNTLKDYKGAIEDYSKVIELHPDDWSAYYRRAYSKINIGDTSGACLDYTKTIELGNKDAEKEKSEFCK